MGNKSNDSEIKKFFSRCWVEEDRLYLADEALARTMFVEVKERISAAGGKWQGGKKQYFLFPFSAEKTRLSLELGDWVNFKQDNQFFETPEEVIALMALFADVEKGHDILEPQAGRFAIGKWLQEYCVTYDNQPIDCYELNEYNQDYLRGLPLANLLGGDFLQASPSHKKYDVILSNPPFANFADIDHITHMTKFLKPNGIIVSVASFSWQKSISKKAAAFRGFLSQQSRHEVTNLDPEAFKSTGTKVATCIVTINGTDYF